MVRELHWLGIAFGTGAGLISTYVLFAISGTLIDNIIVLLLIQLIGFGVAGFVAGRFALVHASVSGRIAALLLFFIVTVMTVAAGASANIVGLLLLGVLSIFGGGIGARIAVTSRAS